MSSAKSDTHAPFHIVVGTQHQAAEAAAVVASSIVSLCKLDHNDDPSVVEGWIKNKTESNFAKWMGLPGIFFPLAKDENNIVAGVGAVHRDGRVILNYVSPTYRFQGVSKMLLKAMEKWLVERECALGTLTSTATARSFYLNSGWIITGGPVVEAGIVGFPMQKDFLEIDVHVRFDEILY